jgi:hypothetical protein
MSTTGAKVTVSHHGAWRSYFYFPSVRLLAPMS